MTMAFGQYAEEAELALEAVKIAGRLCSQIQGSMVDPALTKSDRSPVTVADFAAQAVAARMLKKRFPDDPLVAEEDSERLRDPEGAKTLAAVTGFVNEIHPNTAKELVCDWIDRGKGAPAGRFWVLDPIDGTKGFLRGDQYVVALALVEGGRVVLGALGCPNLGADLSADRKGSGAALVAVRGQGSWAVGFEGGIPRKLKVSDCADPARARILRSFESELSDAGKIDEVASGLGTSESPVRMDSQAKFAMLADGRAELLFRLLSPGRPDYVEKIWDQAAGSIVVEEAGGMVTDLAGRPLDFTCGRRLEANVGVVSSNGLLHEAALAALRAVSAHKRPS